MSTFRDRLQCEWEKRRERNLRYSLRAFAAFLGTDHSTLSQILRRQRRIPIIPMRRWCEKLGMTPEEIAVYVAEQYVPDELTARRHAQLRHWTSEGIAIVTDHTHWHIVRLTHSKRFQTDCRWIANELGVSVDRVNLALGRLLHLRLLGIDATRGWKDLTGKGGGKEGDFQMEALARVRKMAAVEGIDFRLQDNPLTSRKDAR